MRGVVAHAGHRWPESPNSPNSGSELGIDESTSEDDAIQGSSRRTIQSSWRTGPREVKQPHLSRGQVVPQVHLHGHQMKSALGSADGPKKAKRSVSFNMHIDYIDIENLSSLSISDRAARGHAQHWPVEEDEDDEEEELDDDHFSTFRQGRRPEAVPVQQNQVVQDSSVRRPRMWTSSRSGPVPRTSALCFDVILPLGDAEQTHGPAPSLAELLQPGDVFMVDRLDQRSGQVLLRNADGSRGHVAQPVSGPSRTDTANQPPARRWQGSRWQGSRAAQELPPAQQAVSTANGRQRAVPTNVSAMDDYYRESEEEDNPLEEESPSLEEAQDDFGGEDFPENEEYQAPAVASRSRHQQLVRPEPWEDEMQLANARHQARVWPSRLIRAAPSSHRSEVLHHQPLQSGGSQALVAPTHQSLHLRDDRGAEHPQQKRRPEGRIRTYAALRNTPDEDIKDHQDHLIGNSHALPSRAAARDRPLSSTGHEKHTSAERVPFRERQRIPVREQVAEPAYDDRPPWHHQQGNAQQPRYNMEDRGRSDPRDRQRQQLREQYWEQQREHQHQDDRQYRTSQPRQASPVQAPEARRRAEEEDKALRREEEAEQRRRSAQQKRAKDDEAAAKEREVRRLLLQTRKLEAIKFQTKMAAERKASELDSERQKTNGRKAFEDSEGGEDDDELRKQYPGRRHAEQRASAVKNWETLYRSAGQQHPGFARPEEQLEFVRIMKEAAERKMKHIAVQNGAKRAAEVPTTLSEDIIEGPAEPDHRLHMRVALVGHQGAGKSTLYGEILRAASVWDSRQLSNFFKEMDRDDTEVRCHAGIETDKARFSLSDVPGGPGSLPEAARVLAETDVVVVVISAKGNEFEKAFDLRGGALREHALLARGLGARSIVVAVNKMKEAQWSNTRFTAIQSAFGEFLQSLGFTQDEVTFVPVDRGELSGTKASWYLSDGLLDCIIARVPPKGDSLPLRMLLSEAKREKAGGFVLVTGRVECGCVEPGQECMLAIVNAVETTCKVQAVLCNGREVTSASRGEDVQLRLDLPSTTDVPYGSVLSALDQPVQCTQRLTAMLDVLQLPPEKPLITVGFRAVLHCHALQTDCEIIKIMEVRDLPSGEADQKAKHVRAGQSANLVLKLDDSLPAEEFAEERGRLGRLALRTNGHTVGVGFTVEA